MIHVCPPQPKGTLALDAVLGVGFGEVTVRRDDVAVWSGDSDDVTLEGFDNAASFDKTDAKWSVEFRGPLSGSTYTRDGEDDFNHGYWRLTDKNEGFA